MSVENEHVVIIGVKLDFNTFDYDELEDYIVGKRMLDCYYDGMNGNYIYIGKLLSTGDDEYGLDSNSYTLENAIETFGEVETMLKNELGINDRVELHTFTHCS